MPFFCDVCDVVPSDVYLRPHFLQWCSGVITSVRSFACLQDFLTAGALPDRSPSLALLHWVVKLYDLGRRRDRRRGEDERSNNRFMFRQEVRDGLHIDVKKKKGLNAWEVVSEGSKCMQSSAGWQRTRRGGVKQAQRGHSEECDADKEGFLHVSSLLIRDAGTGGGRISRRRMRWKFLASWLSCSLIFADRGPRWRGHDVLG